MLFRNYNIKENAGAEAKPGGAIMVLQCKKGKLFVTGEVFLLDIGLLMGDNHILENLFYTPYIWYCGFWPIVVLKNMKSYF